MVPIGGNQATSSNGSSSVNSNVDLTQLQQMQQIQHIQQMQHAHNVYAAAMQQQHQQHNNAAALFELQKHMAIPAQGNTGDPNRAMENILKAYQNMGLLQPIQQQLAAAAATTAPSVSQPQPQQQQSVPSQQQHHHGEYRRHDVIDKGNNAVGTSSELTVDTSGAHSAAAVVKSSPAVASSPKTGDENELSALVHQKGVISNELETTEKQQKETDKLIEAANKRKERQKHILTEEDDPNDELEDSKTETTQAVPLWKSILDENRKLKSQVEANVHCNLRIHDGSRPLYFDPSDAPGMKNLFFEYRNTFKQKLIRMLKIKKEKEEKLQSTFAKQYEQKYEEWREKDTAFENSPDRIAKEHRWRSIFEQTFKELGKQRGEKERQVRLEGRVEYMSVNTDDNEIRKKFRAAAIPPLNHGELMFATNGFFDNDNMVVKNVCDLEKKRLSDFESKWTEDELRLFKVKLSNVGKNFANIAEYFEDKSVKDCVQCYYLLIKKYNKEYKSMLPKKKRNLKTKYKAPPMPTAQELSKVLQSGFDTENPTGAPIVPHVRCAKCQQKLDPTENPGRINTRAFVDTYGRSDKKGAEVQICSKCYEQEQKLRGSRCLVSSCINGAKKLKPTKVLPARWRQLTDRQKIFLHSDLGIPREVMKTCHTCNRKILKRLEQVFNGELDEEINRFEADAAQGWQDDEVAKLLYLVEEMGTDDWESVAEQMDGRDADECRMQYANTRKSSPTSEEDEDNDEDTETRDRADDEETIIEETQDIPEEPSVKKEEPPSPEPTEVHLSTPTEQITLPTVLVKQEPPKVGSITAGTPVRPPSVAVLDAHSTNGSQSAAVLPSTPQLPLAAAASSSASATPQPNSLPYLHQHLQTLLAQTNVAKDPEQQRKILESFAANLNNVGQQQAQGMQMNISNPLDQLNNPETLQFYLRYQEQKKKQENELAFAAQRQAAEQLQQLQQQQALMKQQRQQQQQQLMSVISNPAMAQQLMNFQAQQQQLQQQQQHAKAQLNIIPISAPVANQDTIAALETAQQQLNHVLSQVQDVVRVQGPQALSISDRSILTQVFDRFDKIRNQASQEHQKVKKEVEELEAKIKEAQEQIALQSQNEVAYEAQAAQMLQQLTVLQQIAMTCQGPNGAQQLLQMQQMHNLFNERFGALSEAKKTVTNAKMSYQARLEELRAKKEKHFSRLQMIQAKLTIAATIPATLHEIPTATTTAAQFSNLSQQTALLQLYQQQLLRSAQATQPAIPPPATTAASMQMAAILQHQQQQQQQAHQAAQLLRMQQEEAAKMQAAKQAAAAAAANLPVRKDNTAWIETARAPDKRGSGMLDRVGKQVVREELAGQQQQQQLQQQPQPQQHQQPPQTQPQQAQQQQMVSPGQQHHQQAHQEPIKRKSGLETVCATSGHSSAIRHPTMQAPMIRRPQSPTKPTVTGARVANTTVSTPLPSLPTQPSQIPSQQISPNDPTSPTQFVKGLNFLPKEQQEQTTREHVEHEVKETGEHAAAAMAKAQPQQQAPATMSQFMAMTGFPFLPLQNFGTSNAVIPNVVMSTDAPAEGREAVTVSAPNVHISPVTKSQILPASLVSPVKTDTIQSAVKQPSPFRKELAISHAPQPIRTNGLLGEIEPMSPPEEEDMQGSLTPPNMGNPQKEGSDEICSFLDDVYFPSSPTPFFRPREISTFPRFDYENTPIVEISDDDEDERMDTQV